MKTTILFWVFVVMTVACKQNNDSAYNIESGFLNDTTGKEECFADFIKTKFKRFNNDSLASRMVFPFIYMNMLGSTEDFRSERFASLAELSGSESYHEVMSLIRNSINYEHRFLKIFATSGLPERTLKISYRKSKDRLIFYYFITKNGRWYIKSFQIAPIFSDGGVPIDEPEN